MKNGMNGSLRVILVLVSIIVTLVLFIGFPSLVSGVVCNDKESRARDTVLDDKIDDAYREQTQRIGDIETSVGKIQVNVDWIRETMENAG